MYTYTVLVSVQFAIGLGLGLDLKVCDLGLCSNSRVVVGKMRNCGIENAE